jgi:hypothetical protein
MRDKSDIKMWAGGGWRSMQNAKVWANGAWRDFHAVYADGDWNRINNGITFTVTIKAGVSVSATGYDETTLPVRIGLIWYTGYISYVDFNLSAMITGPGTHNYTLNSDLIIQHTVPSTGIGKLYAMERTHPGVPWSMNYGSGSYDVRFSGQTITGVLSEQSSPYHRYLLADVNGIIESPEEFALLGGIYIHEFNGPIVVL